MPREEVNLDYRVEYLQILDKDGQVDEGLEPDLSSAFLRKLYRAMLLGRRFDERMFKMQRQGRIGTFPPIKGQEAANIGAIAALEASDWMIPAFRETAAELWRGRSMVDVLLYFAGYSEGGYVPENARTLPISVPVGSQIVHAAGVGYGIQYQGKDDVAIVFFGDGATSEGDFHEGLNFAGVFKLPVIFLNQNNQWAISVPRSQQTNAKTLAQKALAYGMPGLQVDGNDVLAMYVATREAAERARAGEGPTLIEAVTYRLSVHTTADDPTRYRSDEEVEKWEARDPLKRFRRYLFDKDVLQESDVDALEEEIDAEIRAAVKEAEQKIEEPVDPQRMFEHVYAELPPYLQEQKEALARDLAAREEVS
jgi:pyruvate dehydrogenase E1 component alpha subunit